MAEEEEESELSDKQKVEIAKWFLLNSPPGEIQYVAKGPPLLSHYIPLFFFFKSILQNSIPSIVFSADVKSILNDENLYNEAASEAFPVYNKTHLISLQMPHRSGDVTNHLSPYFLGFPHLL